MLLAGVAPVARAVRFLIDDEAGTSPAPSSTSDFRRAAALHRQSRAAGYTICRTLDCLIASVCVREEAQLLHADADFDHLAACTAPAVAGPPT